MNNKILEAIRYKNALLFLGSGFSLGAINTNNTALPNTEKLANKISNIDKSDKFEANGNLKYATARILSKKENKYKLIQLLKSLFTVKEVSSYHKILSKLQWKRVYTTNYDNVFEVAANQQNVLYETVDVEEDAALYQASNNICIHINGSLKGLNEETLNTSFKLSNNSYLTAEGFVLSKWYRQFKQDLDNSTAIIFIGYSLYDIDIEKILFENSEYKDKIYFINGSNLDEESKFTLSQYGKILNFTVSDFANWLDKNLKSTLPTNTDLNLLSLIKYSPTYDDIYVRDKDVEQFLLLGDIQQEIIDTQTREPLGSPILIRRTELDTALESIKQNNNIAVISEFGNGKTTFLKVLCSKLALLNYEVFISDTNNSIQLDELERIVKSGIKGCLVIDVWDKNFDLVQKFLDLRPANLTLVIATRTHAHDSLFSRLKDNSLDFIEIELDQLTNYEVEEFLSILDNTTYWRRRAGFPLYLKKKVIIEDNHNEIASNLLDILNSPHIVDKIEELAKNVLKNKDYKDTVFAIALLKLNNEISNRVNISEVAMSDLVYNSDFKKNESIRQILYFTQNQVDIRSSTFASSLITTQFEHDYIVEQLLKIIEKIEVQNLKELKRFQRSLFRFSSVERLLSKNKRTSLVLYFERLKNIIKRQTRDPHYWLQFGMAHLSLEDFPKAGDCFKTAYSYAKSRQNYHTNELDTQQARLNLKLAVKEVDINKAFKLFESAHDLLNSIPNDAFRYKQVDGYQLFYNSIYMRLKPGDKVKFEHACKLMLNEAESYLNRPKAKRKYIVDRAHRKLDNIITDILSNR